MGAEARRRKTRQLTLVLDAVRASGTEHPSADRIFARVREVMPTISLGTVYRNLHRLAADGCIGIVHLGDRLARFDPTPGGHDHFVCEQCGRIEDLPATPLDLEANAARQAGHQVTGHALVLYGRCRECGTSPT
ncbi:MAG: transcriptional repressor [Deltaproteobacteria bacterium]|nr:MAG: transcriptional repressor [Deltaproteobacteria bacterium]